MVLNTHHLQQRRSRFLCILQPRGAYRDGEPLLGPQIQFGAIFRALRQEWGRWLLRQPEIRDQKNEKADFIIAGAGDVFEDLE